MIKSWSNRGLKAFFETGSRRGINPAHASRLRRQLDVLDAASVVGDMNVPGWRLHPLQGARTGEWSVDVNGPWRLTFQFRDGNAYSVDYEQYH
jgi:proteic killer suppression protein